MVLEQNMHHQNKIARFGQICSSRMADRERKEVFLIELLKCDCIFELSFIQWVLQVMLPSECSFIVDVSLSYIYLSLFLLHVSAYMAIFMCASLVLLACGYTLLVSSVGWVKYEVLLFIIIFMLYFLYCYSEADSFKNIKEKKHPTHLKMAM
jgi:hypothetical protein